VNAGQVLRRSGSALVLAGTLLGVLYAQRPFRRYPSVEGYESMPLPPDWRRQAEWVFARLMYPPGPLDGYFPRFQEKTMKMVFPERPIVDIPNDDPIFHTVFDLNDRYRITGAEHLDTGYKKDGRVARWQGIYDDRGRVMVAISLNSDIGDSWEWSDTPQYPLRFSDLGIRIGVNYVVYAMTH
jgi:hypothetical protein